MSWFISKSGKRLMRFAAVASTIGGFCVYYVPNTLLINKYKEVTALYRLGITPPVSENILSLAEEVMTNLKISEMDQSLIKLYTGYGFDVFRAGSTLTKYGGVIGLPINLKYSKIGEFDPTDIILNNEPVQWSNPDGYSLKQSLILSDDAKKYILARELYHLTTAEPILHAACTSCIIANIYMFALAVNSKYNFYARPRGLRFFWYALLSTFGFGMYCFMKDFSTCLYEHEADTAISKLGLSYAKGGLEFYNKLLQRNKALRNLLGDKGIKLFSAYGNNEVLIRTRHLPITMRQDYFKKEVEEYAKNEDILLNKDTLNPS